MKIRCDVCNKDEAAVYCTADEAALCSGCDHRVHHANKLAGKHQRFSLILPLPKQFPLCDICQEKRAFLFCQQDRAILCKDCDIPIHKVNEHTQNHNRYLLTGVKLSATSSLYSPPSTSSPINVVNKSVLAKTPMNPCPSTIGISSEKVLNCNNNNEMTSVSQYLMEMPGWHIEDLLDSSSTHSFGLCKPSDDSSPWNGDLYNNLSPISSSESFGIWVPQAPTSLYSSSNISFGAQVGYKAKEINSNKSNKKSRDDNSYAVPQINSPSSVSKRSRIYW